MKLSIHSGLKIFLYLFDSKQSKLEMYQSDEFENLNSLLSKHEPFATYTNKNYSGLVKKN